MSISLIDRIRDRVSRPTSAREVESLVGFALATWVFGQILFSYSTFAQIPLVKRLDVSMFHQAIVAGCLIAALASMEFRLSASDVALLFVALFSTLTVWRRAGDPRPLVLTLLIILAREMDRSRLVRFFVAGSLLGMWAVLGASLTGKEMILTSMVDGMLTYAYGFNSPSVLACLLLSIVVAMILGRLLTSVRAIVALCVACAATCVFVLHNVHVGMAIVAMGALPMAALRWSPVLEGQLQRRSVRWTVAILPIALFVFANDGAKFYGFEPSTGSYGAVIGSYGYAVPIILYVAYARSVLAAANSKQLTLAFGAMVVYALLMLFEPTPIHLEFNCTWLLLSMSWGDAAEHDGWAGRHMREVEQG